MAGLALVALGIPAIFWFRFGETALEVGIGLAAFLILLVLAIELARRVPAPAAPQAYKRSPFDVLGVVWLLSIPFGPFLGWLATEQLTAGNWHVVAGIRAFLCVALPLICVLPLLRFVRGPRAMTAGIILLIGTAFPVVIGLGSARDLVRGPVWESVDVSAVRSVAYAVRGGTTARIPNALVDLSDGRTLRAVPSVAVRAGPVRLLVLQGLGRVLDAH